MGNGDPSMLFKTRISFAIGCAGLLAISSVAFSQPMPKPKPAAERAHKPQSQRAAQQKKKPTPRSERLVSMRVTHQPKPPAFGWPVLVKEARKYMGTNPTDRKRLWCATFMNMVLAKTGYAGTNSDAAKSFAQYGRRIAQPRVGAIAVLTRGKNGGHVGVVSGIDANGNPIIISGNHGRKVGEAIYPRSRVIAYVMPSERSDGDTQVAERSAPPRTASEGGLESPITELLAAIEAEQSRPNRSRQVARQETRQEARQEPRQEQAPAEPHLTVQQSAEPAPTGRRNLRLDPGLAAFLGLRERAQPTPRPAAQPQREQRVERGRTGRVAEESGLAAFLGLPVAR